MKTLTVQEFSQEILLSKPGDTIQIQTNETTFSLIAADHPDGSKKAYIGILGLTNEYKFIGNQPVGNFFFDIFLWLKNLFQWIFVLSFGIGLANLLPLGPVDGGRMLQVALQKIYKNKEKGNMLWKKISILFLLILVINIFFPIIKAVLG